MFGWLAGWLVLTGTHNQKHWQQAEEKIEERLAVVVVVICIYFDFSRTEQQEWTAALLKEVDLYCVVK